ncbi:MAG TPA: ABC transporter substrate-binding protein [Bradyrhizobium sp.]|nr:ABC transporter substrate-binding protein [Bradyrhizobium sp.]
MRRRIFLGGLGLAAASWPFEAHAQQPAMPVIGFLSGVSPGGAYKGAIAGFRQGLADTGYADGINVAIEFRWAEGHYDRLAGMADDLVRRNVSVIVASATGVRAAKAATTTIPIVFMTATDPVETGLVSSLNRPGGNMTGLTLLYYRVEAKRLELFHELVPKAATIRVILNRSNPLAATTERNLREAADAFGLRLDFVDARSDKDIDAAFTMLTERQIGGIFVMSDPFLDNQGDQMATLAARHNMPTSSAQREFPAAGGLMSYGADRAAVYRQAGIYVGKILKGAKPGDLPVLQPTKFDFAINLKAAKALGLTVPQTLLVAADEIIE